MMEVVRMAMVTAIEMALMDGVRNGGRGGGVVLYEN